MIVTGQKNEPRNAVNSTFLGSCTLFKLNRSRRLTCKIIEYAVYALNFINNTVHHLIKYCIRNLSRLRSHEVNGLALGMDIDIGVIVNIMVGIMFIILGNYVHKVKQNYTVGMKLPWTLNSEENWNRTNRMTGWIQILSGLLFLMNSLLLKTEIVFAVILLVILVPMIYSFILYKKGI